VARKTYPDFVCAKCSTKVQPGTNYKLKSFTFHPSVVEKLRKFDLPRSGGPLCCPCKDQILKASWREDRQKATEEARIRAEARAKEFAAASQPEGMSVWTWDNICRHACCPKARPLHCVCMYSFVCPTHGETHIGTHD
jgi:hypothetical protein